MLVFHDDVRPCPEGWTLARDNPTAMKLLTENWVDAISLDHDLGASPDAGLWARGLSPFGDGRDLVRTMIEARVVPASVIIHSWNPSGAREMAAMLRTAGHFPVIKPYEVK